MGEGPLPFSRPAPGLTPAVMRYSTCVDLPSTSLPQPDGISTTVQPVAEGEGKEMMGGDRTVCGFGTLSVFKEAITKSHATSAKDVLEILPLFLSQVEAETWQEEAGGSGTVVRRR